MNKKGLACLEQNEDTWLTVKIFIYFSIYSFILRALVFCLLCVCVNVSEVLELELKAVVSCHVGARS